VASPRVNAVPTPIAIFVTRFMMILHLMMLFALQPPMICTGVPRRIGSHCTMQM
jgi:hypothetical protein